MGMALASGRITKADYELIYAYLLELRVGKGIGLLRMDKLAVSTRFTTGKHMWGISWFAAGRWSPGFCGRKHEPN